MNSKHPLTPSKAWHVTTPLEKYKSSEIIRLKGMERKACLSCLRSNPDVILRRIIRDTLFIITSPLHCLGEDDQGLPGDLEQLDHHLLHHCHDADDQGLFLETLLAPRRLHLLGPLILQQEVMMMMMMMMMMVMMTMISTCLRW